MARCHDVTDAGAITFNLVIYKVMKGGGSIARHPHEFGCERGRHQHLSEPPCIHVRGGREAVGEPIAWRSRWGQRDPYRELAKDIK